MARRYAFCKVKYDADDDRYILDVTVNRPLPAPGAFEKHWSRFGSIKSNQLGWDLCCIYYPADTTGPSLHYIDVDTLNKTIGDIPAQKRQQMKTWLGDHNYDNAWIKNSTTIKAVLMDILHALNDRQGTKADLYKWVKEY